MLIPYIYLHQQRKNNLEESLKALDGYDFPTGNVTEGEMCIEECIDDETGTLDF